MTGRWGARQGKLSRLDFDKADLDMRANALTVLERRGSVNDRKGACSFLHRWGQRLKARGAKKKKTE